MSKSIEDVRAAMAGLVSAAIAAIKSLVIALGATQGALVRLSDYMAASRDSYRENGGHHYVR